MLSFPPSLPRLSFEVPCCCSRLLQKFGCKFFTKRRIDTHLQRLGEDMICLQNKGDSVLHLACQQRTRLWSIGERAPSLRRWSSELHATCVASSACRERMIALRVSVPFSSNRPVLLPNFWNPNILSSTCSRHVLCFSSPSSYFCC